MRMRKLLLFLLYLLLSMIAAGVFGAIHDQISYTVSHEYFTKFKFLQFRLLDPNVPERFRAAEVGFLASWWMGIPLGVLTGAAGFIQKSPGEMLRALLWSLVVIVGFTLAFALCGLLYGYFQTTQFNLAAYQGWFIPKDLEQPRNFLCAGYMHNAAYFGGLLAVPVAWAFHFTYKRQNRDANPQK